MVNVSVHGTVHITLGITAAKDITDLSALTRNVGVAIYF